MRRIPCRLELLHCGGLGGIVRRELVDDEQRGRPDASRVRVRQRRARAARHGGASDGCRRARIRRRESQRLSVSFDELRVRQGACPRELEDLGHRVDPDDLAHERCQRKRQRPAPVPTSRARSSPSGSMKSRTLRRGALRGDPGGRRCAPPSARTAQSVTTRRRSRVGVDPAGELVVIVPATCACASRSKPSPTSVTGVPAGSSRSSSTANESIETVPTTLRGSPSTSTSVPVRSRRNPSA